MCLKITISFGEIYLTEIGEINDALFQMWIFDMPDGTGRLLRVREGHSLPPTTVKFHRNDQIFSAGTDSSLRVFR